MANLFDLTGKTAVIIGGNSTLGGAMAVGLGGHGADVAIVGRNQEKAHEVARAVEAAGGRAQCFSADATNEGDLQRVLDEVLAWTGRCDVLMNCPGKNSTTPFFDLKMDEWDAIMDVNLKKCCVGLPGFWEIYGRAGRGRQHHQYFVGLVRAAVVSRVYVFGVEGGGEQRNEVFGQRVRSLAGARQCDYSRLFPGGAKPENFISRPSMRSCGIRR